MVADRIFMKDNEKQNDNIKKNDNWSRTTRFFILASPPTWAPIS